MLHASGLPPGLPTLSERESWTLNRFQYCLYLFTKNPAARVCLRPVLKRAGLPVEELERAQKRALRKLFSGVLTRLANEALAEVTTFLQKSDFPRASVSMDVFHTLAPLGGLDRPGAEAATGSSGALELDDVPRLLQERLQLRDGLRELKSRLEEALAEPPANSNQRSGPVGVAGGLGSATAIGAVGASEKP